MEPYFFQGVVRPERAQISLNFEFKFVHLTSGAKGRIKVNILLNQIVALAHVDEEWDIYDLRNVVRTSIQNELSTVGYLVGNAYDLEITRVTHINLEVDVVFGIDIPCISRRFEGKNLEMELHAIRAKVTGENGIFLHRCFNDLISAMKHADDTGFYCYRAIESLRHHYSSVQNTTKTTKTQQWKAFREVSGAEEATLKSIKRAADPLRHGETAKITGKERENMLTTTFRIVDDYLNSVGNPKPS